MRFFEPRIESNAVAGNCRYRAFVCCLRRLILRASTVCATCSPLVLASISINKQLGAPDAIKHQQQTHPE